MTTIYVASDPACKFISCCLVAKALSFVVGKWIFGTLLFCVITAAHADNRLQNISTRGVVETGDDVLIGGFVITGSEPKAVVIRARGPSMAAADPNLIGLLEDPYVQLFSGANLIAQNDSWQVQDEAVVIRDDLKPTNDKEAVIAITLDPGAYTAIVRGVGGTTGIGIFEAFEVDETGDARLINISTRGYVGVGDDVLIGGLIISGDTDKTVTIRARGPSMAEVDPNLAGALLEDPYVQLFSGATLIAENDDWELDAGVDDLRSDLTPTSSKEAAITTTLAPGAYTAIVRGVNQSVGIGIVEAFEVNVPEPDPTAQSIFTNNIASQVILGDCEGCHRPTGPAASTRLIYVTESGHEVSNFETIRDYVSENTSRATTFLQKARGEGHGGGARLATNDQRYIDLASFLDQLLVEIEGEDQAPPIPPGLIAENSGHPMFASPHVRPISLAHGNVYVVNTPADTVDVFSATTFEPVARINVGIDPVTVAVRPDRRELWVSNHVSDSISIIDIDPTSPFAHHVLHTIGHFDSDMATLFDEPTGIAFADDNKAYVALGPANQIAIVEDRSVTGHIDVNAQDPRAIAVHDGRLYVLPFESNNQTQLSGCNLSTNPLNGDTCTYDAIEHAFTNNNVLSLNYDADIIKNTNLPDRDLYVYDTKTDQQIQVVNTLGTLLYGMAIDSVGNLYVTQTDARNAANGRAGTLKEGLEELENRAFLNQITSVKCQPRCSNPTFIELEPLPPNNPERGMALATPFGIKVTNDDKTLVVTSAGSNKLFTMDAGSGTVVGRVAVGSVPRGVALDENFRAFVMNAVDNSVSVVDISDRSAPVVVKTITMDDPTHEAVRRGRAAFNDADASSTGTFSCESCHPDGGTDQLLWVLDTPICDIGGCTQIPPRLTMPVRGLRDTEPYHWDGIPGDPYGGNNTRSINAAEAPNCSLEDPTSCTRALVDGSLASTMCNLNNCPTNDEGKEGLLLGNERDDMATFLLSIPFPPAPRRPVNNELTQLARDGIHEFNYVKDCGNCHKMPFLVSSNTPGTGMDAPTWRGAYDRWMILPQGRLNVIDLMNIVNMPNHFPEDRMWGLAGATPGIWQMVLQSSTGFSGAFARQVTLNEETAKLASTTSLLNALIQVAAEDGVLLQGEGLLLGEGNPTLFTIEYRNGQFEGRNDNRSYSQEQLVTSAANGSLLVTLTGRIGVNSDVDAPQPALWQDVPIHQQTSNVNVPWMNEDAVLRFKGRHIQPKPQLFLNGRRVDGTVSCESGSLPNCINDYVLIDLDELPTGGRHLLQVQNENGLYSNDALVYNDYAEVEPRPGNLIESGGTFDEWDESWGTVELNGSITHEARAQRLRINATQSTTGDPWRVQLNHRVWFVGGQTYTICFRARATASRNISVYTDIAEPPWTVTGQGSIRGGQYPITLGTTMQQYSRTFTIEETDTSGRIAFDLAQHTAPVFLDDVGVYEGSSCGTP